MANHLSDIFCIQSRNVRLKHTSFAKYNYLFENICVTSTGYFLGFVGVNLAKLHGLLQVADRLFIILVVALTLALAVAIYIKKNLKEI